MDQIAEATHGRLGGPRNSFGKGRAVRFQTLTRAYLQFNVLQRRPMAVQKLIRI